MKKLLIGLIFSMISIDSPAEFVCVKEKDLNKSNYKYQPKELNEWFLSREKTIKGVAVAFHGLNAKPSMMNPLINFLNNEGVHVLRGALRGHRGSLEEMETVTREQWLQDVSNVYCNARKKADQLGVPLIWIGHSLGGLIIYDLLFQNKELKIDKAILFAPAFKIHWHLNFFSFIFNIKDSWALPSRNLPQYRSQEVCTFAAYRALMESINSLNLKGINLPTLILMDPGDELVDYDEIEDLIKEHKINNWQLVAVDTSKTTHKKIYRHLAFNKECFGDQEWNRIQKIMEEFLWAQNGMK